MNIEKKLDGNVTELMAVEWYRKRNAVILEKNYRCRMGEIDLICEEVLKGGDTELVFVEVRARREGGVQNGIQSVDTVKRRKIIRTAEYFLARYRGEAIQIRFDIWSWNGNTWLHLPNAW